MFIPVSFSLSPRRGGAVRGLDGFGYSSNRLRRIAPFVPPNPNELLSP
jgi:hypothetical protein